jgi:Ca2+-binding EF-hand superfamily protein
MILLTMVIYLFAVLFTQAASDHLIEHNFFGASSHLPHPLDMVVDGSGRGVLYRYFGSMSASMLTLFTSITGGVSWDVVIQPLHEIHFFWVVVFIAYVAFAYFAVLNVVTGVFCQSAIDAAQRDDDMALQSVISNKSIYVDQLTKLFTKIDDRQDGVITIADFERHLHDENVISFFHTLELDVSDAWSLFKLLDLDNSNNVDLDEFIIGCTRLKGNAKSIDMAQVMYDCRWLMKRFAAFSLWAEERFDLLDVRMTSAGGTAARLSSPPGQPAALSPIAQQAATKTMVPSRSAPEPTRSSAPRGARSETEVDRPTCLKL